MKKKSLVFITIFIFVFSLIGCAGKNKGKINEPLTVGNISITASNLRFIESAYPKSGKKWATLDVKIENNSKKTVHIRCDDGILDYNNGYEFVGEHDSSDMIYYYMGPLVFLEDLEPLCKDTYRFAWNVPKELTTDTKPLVFKITLNNNKFEIVLR